MMQKLKNQEKIELNNLISRKYLTVKHIKESCFGDITFPKAISNARQILWHISNSIDSVPLCPVCSSELGWHPDKRRYRDFCSQKCTGIGTKEKAVQTSKDNNGGVHHTQTQEYRDKVKETSLKRFNTEHYSKTSEYHQRVISSNLKTFGAEYPAQSSTVLDKMKSTSVERFGVDNYAKTDECRNKTVATNLERYGFANPTQNADIQSKTRSTNFDRYGANYPTQNEAIMTKIVDTRRKNYYSEDTLRKLNDIDWLSNEQKTRTIQSIAGGLDISPSNLGKFYMNYRIPITNVNPHTSDAEKEVVAFIQTLGITNIIQNDKTTISPKELDILIPDHNLAIEFNGTYWHTQGKGKDKQYHLSKTTACESKGIQLLHISDFEWGNLVSQSIWKSMISVRLQRANRIYARKCKLKEVSTKDAVQFMKNNHLEGFVGGGIKLGLYHRDILVQCIIVGKSRFNKRYQNELIRSATLVNTVVIGGLSRLIKNIKGSLISYANRKYANGKGYNAIGMVQQQSSPPNYVVTTKNGLIVGSRYKFQKHKLDNLLDKFDPNMSGWSNIQANGYDRIWDCGNLVYTLNAK